MAVASDATRVRATKKMLRFIAIRTPMSRTRPARSAYSASSRASLPKTLTSRAPATLKRSVMRLPMSALSPIWACVRPASRWPITRAGMMKNGTSASAARVSCQDSVAMVPTMRASETTLLTTLDRTEVKACCAPSTSLLSRLTRAPVWARVKNAMGWRSTWAKTWVRRS